MPGQVHELNSKAGEARKGVCFAVGIEPFQGGVRVSNAIVACIDVNGVIVPVGKLLDLELTEAGSLQ